VRICAFEDAAAGNLYPLTATRPAFALRCGITTLLDKQCRFFAAQTVGAQVRPALAELCRSERPELCVNDPAWLHGAAEGERVVLVNGRWLPPAQTTELPSRTEVGMVGDEVAYVVLPATEAKALTPDRRAWQLARWRDEWPRRAAGGSLISYPWDLIRHNAAALEDDFRQEKAARPTLPLPAGLTLVGPADRLLVEPSAKVEPLALIDTSKGPVLIDRGAVVQAFSRVEGPCYVGPDTQVLGGRLKGSSLGPQCRIGGECEETIVHGFSNKAHDGFLGHSYLGEWVNFGAGTQTSDLRTDYETVRFVVQGHKVDSGLIKVGAFVGDHAKTSVSALLNTGSMIGPFALLLASGTLLPRPVPAFCEVAHGRLQERNDLREMFATAATMMGRRDREWTLEHTEFFLQLYEETAEARRQALRENEQRRMRRVV
jgi:UDP-N-acetylglucosamine diphosphorylase/glucosamine-1-phosphate N-acetyltransferase